MPSSSSSSPLHELCKGNGQDPSEEGCSGVMEAAVDESMSVLSRQRGVKDMLDTDRMSRSWAGGAEVGGMLLGAGDAGPSTAGR